MLQPLQDQQLLHLLHRIGRAAGWGLSSGFVQRGGGRMQARNTVGFVCLMALGMASAALGQTSPLPGAIQPGTVHASFNTIASGLTSPVALMSAPGDPSDLYVVDQAGKIDVIHNGVMQATPLIDLSALESGVPLNPGYDERGLLG